MCTLVALIAPELALPVVIAANRDELLDRPALPFARHWPGRPWQAGQDELAGGTWAGVHDDGFGVFLLNRVRSLGPAPGKRSRGQLALDLLDAGSPDRAVRRARELPPDACRPFHAIVASAEGVVGLTGGGGDAAHQRELSPGVTMWTALGANTDASTRQSIHRAAFEEAFRHWSASGSEPELFGELERLLARPAPPGGSSLDAMCIEDVSRGFGTRSSLIVGFGGSQKRVVRIRVADGPPDRTAFRDV